MYIVMAYVLMLLPDRESRSKACTGTVFIQELPQLPEISMVMEDNLSLEENLTMSEPVQCSDEEVPTSTLSTAQNVGVCISQVSLYVHVHVCICC
jgi:hypothetical protein